MVNRKRVIFCYDSAPEGQQVDDKIVMTFRDNLVAKKSRTLYITL